MCAESQQGCSGKEECVLHDADKRNHCYVLWTIDNVTKKSIIKLKVSESCCNNIIMESSDQVGGRKKKIYVESF